VGFVLYACSSRTYNPSHVQVIEMAVHRGKAPVLGAR
jgi:hypothetical protein